MLNVFKTLNEEPVEFGILGNPVMERKSPTWKEFLEERESRNTVDNAFISFKLDEDVAANIESLDNDELSEIINVF